MNRCKKIQQQITELSLTELKQDTDLQQHIVECEQCSAFLDALTELETEISELPIVDAPDALVVNTLQAVEKAGEPLPAISGFERNRLRWASGFAAVFVTISIAGLWQAGMGELIMQRNQFEAVSSSLPRSTEQYDQPVDALEYDQSDSDSGAPEPSVEDSSAVPQSPQVANTPAPSSALLVSHEIEDTHSAESFARTEQNQQGALNELEALTQETRKRIQNKESRDQSELSLFALDKIKREPSSQAGQSNGINDDGATAAAQPKADLSPAELRRVSVTGSRLSHIDIEGAQPVTSIDRSDIQTTGLTDLGSSNNALDQSTTDDEVLLLNPDDYTDVRNLSNESVSVDALRDAGILNEKPFENYPLTDSTNTESDRPKETLINHRQNELALLAEQINRQTEVNSPINKSQGASFIPQRETAVVKQPVRKASVISTAAQNFLHQLDSLDDVHYQPATGYWANTYIPGDPAMRLLQAQVNQWNHNAATTDLSLEQAAQQIWQPFDAPQGTALATYLHSNKTFIDGPTRLQLQVGLQASEHESGQRPALDLAVVLDMHGTTAQQFDTEIRALLQALQEAKQTGDRFSLTIAGKPGGLMIPAGEFRHGPVSIAINQLFSDQDTPSGNEWSLLEAITKAANDLNIESKADKALGTRQILLITGQPIQTDMQALKDTIHQQAVNGLMLSAVTLGGQTIAEQIDSLVLAGQGNRRTLLNVDDAKPLIEQELYSASRTVARAIRIRIQLAPGVKLIQVHGSERLDTRQIERVKQAENSIDQRLAENLGIVADRGDDETGIQMVIPAMSAGTSHVILLDVMASQPGPVADVRVRYKDLTKVRNSVTQAQLSIDSEQTAAGKLERNVVKNLLALELAERMTQASQRLAVNDLNGTKLQLQKAHQLVNELRQQLPGWRNDQELLQDEQMLSGFLTALRSPIIAQTQQREMVVASLQLAAYRKVTGPIESE